jgi:Holliday junction resolvase RusA-like endonuclease
MFLTIKNLNIPPSKKNSRIISTINGRVRSFASKNYSIWHAQAFYMIKNQLGMSFNTIDFPCEIDILFGRKNNRKWDLTNIEF